MTKRDHEAAPREVRLFQDAQAREARLFERIDLLEARLSRVERLAVETAWLAMYPPNTQAADIAEGRVRQALALLVPIGTSGDVAEPAAAERPDPTAYRIQHVASAICRALGFKPDAMVTPGAPRIGPMCSVVVPGDPVPAWTRCTGIAYAAIEAMAECDDGGKS